MPADRRRSRDGGQQQRRRGAARAQHAREPQGGARLARRADRDRRVVPHPGHHVPRGLSPARSRHHEPHAPRRLCERDRAADRSRHEGAHQQLRGRGIHGFGAGSRARGPMPGARRSVRRRSRQRDPGRSARVRPAPRADARGDPGERRRSRHVQRRQASRRTAGRHHRRACRPRRENQAKSSEAGVARRQDDHCRTRGGDQSRGRSGASARAAAGAPRTHPSARRSPPHRSAHRRRARADAEGLRRRGHRLQRRDRFRRTARTGIASAAVAITPRAAKGRGRALQRLSEAFRALPVPVIGRVQDDACLLDCRTLVDAQETEWFIAQLGSLRSLDQR